MTTIIDRLVVELGLDPKGYDKGSKEVREGNKRIRDEARSQSNEMEAYGKRAGAFFGKLKSEVAGLALAFAGASTLKGFVADILTGDAATGRFAASIGMATQDVSAWQLALESVGGTADEARGTLGALADAYQKAKLTGTTGNDAAYARLGLRNMSDFADPAEALMKIARAKKALGLDDSTYTSRLKDIGMSPSMITLLRQGPEALGALIEAKRKDAAANDKDAKASADLEAKISDLYAKIKKEARPAIYGMVEAFQAVDEKIGLVNIAVPVLTGLLGALAVAAAAATWEWVLIAGAIGAALAAAQAYGRYVEETRREGNARRGVQRFDLDKTGGAGRYPGPVTYRNSDGRMIDAETVRQINSGARQGQAGGGGNTDYARALAAQGFSPTMVAAILANGHHESGWNASRVGDGGKARGVLQWHPDRQADFRRQFGTDVSRATPDQVARFIAWEMKNNVSDKGRNAIARAEATGDAGLTAAAFDEHYERSAGLSRAARMATARSLARASTRVPARATVASGSTSNTSSVGTIIINTAATDAKGIAAELPGAIASRGLVTQANRGLE